MKIDLVNTVMFLKKSVLAVTLNLIQRQNANKITTVLWIKFTDLYQMI